MTDFTESDDNWTVWETTGVSYCSEGRTYWTTFWL